MLFCGCSGTCHSCVCTYTHKNIKYAVCVCARARARLRTLPICLMESGAPRPLQPMTDVIYCCGSKVKNPSSPSAPEEKAIRKGLDWSQ